MAPTILVKLLLSVNKSIYISDHKMQKRYSLAASSDDSLEIYLPTIYSVGKILFEKIKKIKHNKMKRSFQILG